MENCQLKIILLFDFFSTSVSNIIEEYEEQQERARNQAKGAASNKAAAQNKRGELSGLLGSGTTTNDLEFSFGGPVADEGGVYILG